jgi:hypothetical protein
LTESTPGTLSEIGFYTPLATQVFGVLPGYPPAQRVINKSGKHGIPGIRLNSQEDNSEWAVVEAKIEDQKIRDSPRGRKYGGIKSLSTATSALKPFTSFFVPHALSMSATWTASFLRLSTSNLIV